MTNISKRLRKDFDDFEYRHAYSEGIFDTLIAGQLRKLRGKQTQSDLADATGTSQSTISEFESDDYSRWSIPTLRKFARLFDVALVVKFAPFSEVVEEAVSVGRSISVTRYEEDELIASVPPPSVCPLVGQYQALSEIAASGTAKMAFLPNLLTRATAPLSFAAQHFTTETASNEWEEKGGLGHQELAARNVQSGPVRALFNAQPGEHRPW